MSDPVLIRKLDEIDAKIADVKADVDDLRIQFLPAYRFYVQATGVLGALRWIGSGTVLLLIAGAVWMALPR